MDYFESTIKTYSGLSTETKPTIALGTSVPNGSRWREIDTKKVFYFNQSDDTWYLGERLGQTQIISSSGNEVAVRENTHVSEYELAVNLRGHVCAENSSSLTLGIGGIFAGAWQDTLDYGTVTIGVKADQNSATNGLLIQWSADGISVHDEDTFTITANRGKVFTFGPARRYVKLTYTNGSIAQTTFSLQTILRRVPIKDSSHRINDSIVGEDDASLHKSVITGLRDDGVFGNVGISSSNRIKTVSQSYLLAVAEGDIPNHYPLLKFGTRTSVAAGTQSVVWEGTAALYTYLTTAEQLKISSSSVNDTATTGTGLRTLRLVGLDANFAEAEETIDMAGTGVVTSANSYIRIFRAYGETCGSLYTNAGTITITNNAGTVQLLVINPNDGQTLMSMWTVPAGTQLYLTQASFSTDSNKGARVSIFTRLLDGGILYPWRIRYRAYAFSGNEMFPFNIPFVVPAKTDIEIRVTTPASAGTTSCGATFEGWYETV